jgi:hypothetical protein
MATSDDMSEVAWVGAGSFASRLGCFQKAEEIAGISGFVFAVFRPQSQRISAQQVGLFLRFNTRECFEFNASRWVRFCIS